MDVTPADSQSISVTQNEFFQIGRPAMGLNLFYAQRENRLIHWRNGSLPLSSVCVAGGGEEKKKNGSEENRGFEAGAERSFGDARPDLGR
jgi:hypothetical protein